MIDETQGPEPKKKKSLSQLVADSTQGAMFQGTAPPKKSLSQMVEEKNQQLLPVDETATAPQATAPVKPVNADGMPIINQGAKRLYVGQAQEGNVVTKAARNVVAYGANRLADLGDATINAAISSVPIFTHPVESLISLYKGAQQVTDTIDTGAGNLIKSMQSGNAVGYLKKDFAEETVWNPLKEMADHVIGTPMDVMIFQPFFIATTGNQPSTNEELKGSIADALPDIAATVAGAYFGQALRERQLIANVARTDGKMAAEFATNPSKMMTEQALKNRIAMLPVEDIAKLGKDLPLYVKASQLTSQVLAESAAAGTAYGLTMQGTAEEKLNAAFQMTAFGIPFIAGIHGVVHVAGKLPVIRRIVGGVSEFDRIRDAADKTLMDVQLRDVMKLPYSERVAALANFANRISPAEILARSMDRGIIHGVDPAMRASFGETGYTYFDRGDGKFNVLVDRTKNVDPEAYANHPEGLEQRVKTAEEEAAQKTLTEIALTNDKLYAEIEALRAAGEMELAAEKLRELDQRNFMQREMHRDPLTGANNRRALDLALPAAEADPNVTILVHDLNRFKQVNDTHGHPAGDQVLKAFVDHVRDVVKRNGLDWRDVFRYGGDEFATILKDNQSPALVQKIKAEIDAFNHVITGDGSIPPTEVTVSTGSGPSFSVADKAMYKVKTGKGHSEPTPFSQSDSFFTETDRAHFRATGFIPFQKVSFNGTDWYVHEVAGNLVKLIDAEGNVIVTAQNKVRRLPDLEVASPNLELNTILDAPIDEPGVPKEPGFRKVATRVEGPPNKVTAGQMLNLDAETLTNKGIDVATKDKNVEIELFGEEMAKKYDKAKKFLDKSTDETSQKHKDAQKLVDDLEEGLTKEQQNRLFGIGDESYVAPDEYLDAARAAQNYGPVELASKTANQLITSMAHLVANVEKGTYRSQAIARIYRDLLQRLEHEPGAGGEISVDKLVNDVINKIADVAAIELDDASVLARGAVEDAMKIIMDEPDTSPRMGFRAELVKPVDQIDINARSQNGQPAYNVDPDVMNMRPKGRNGINIDFASWFDKAVYMLVRTSEEMQNYGKERKLQVEARMMQFAKKVGIPIKELEAHKIKLMDQIARAEQSMGEQLREIGMEPELPGDMPRTPYIDIAVQPFEGQRSKFIGIKFDKVGKVIDAGNVMDLLTPEEKAIVAENKAAYDEHIRDIATGRVKEMNDNGIILKMEGSTVRAIGPDGKTVATFNSVDEALQFRVTASNAPNTGRAALRGDLADGSGSVAPPANVGNSGDLGGGSIPPTAGNIPIDGYYDPYGGPNWVNRFARFTSFIQGKYLKPRLGALRDFALQYGLDDVRIGADRFDAEAMRAAAENVGYHSRINKMFKAAAKISSDRVKMVLGNFIKVLSVDDAMSNIQGRMFNNARPATPETFTYSGKVAGLAEKAVVGSETPGEAMARSLRLLKGIRQLAERYKTEAAKQDPAYIKQMEDYKNLIQNKASSDLVNLLDEITKKDVGTVDLFEVVGIAESILNKTADRTKFAAANNMTPHEISVATDMRTFIREVAAKHGFDGDYLTRVMDQIGRHNGGTFEGSIYSMQKGWKPEQVAFLQQLIRDPGNIAFERDPFKLMSNLNTTSVRSRILGPAKAEYLERVDIELQAAQDKANFDSIAKNDNDRSAAKMRRVNDHVRKVVNRYADEVVGRLDGFDDIVNDAFNDTLNRISKRLGSSKEFDINVRKSVLGTINRIFESAAQGFRPAAGAVDFIYTTEKLLTEYPIDRFVKMMFITEKAIRAAAELQKQGKISGIQIIIPEDMAGPTTGSRIGRFAKTAFDEFSETGFKWSGQPDVFKFYGAVIYTEALGRVSEAAKKFGTSADPKNMLKVADYLTLDMHSPVIRREFFKQYLHGGVEQAAEFYARESNRHFQVQYGRGQHPEMFGTVIGRAFGTFGSWPLAAFDSWRQNLANRSWPSMIRWGGKFGLLMWGQYELQKKSGLDLRRFSANPLDWLTWRGSPMVGLAGSLQDYAYAKSVGNEYLAREAEWQIKNYAPNGAAGDLPWLQRLTPFDTQDPNWGSITVPGSYGAQDARSAYQELSNGNLMQAILSELGAKPAKK